MLIAFSVQNHRSIDERQVLSLESTDDEHLADSRVLKVGKMRLLRSVAIYGPNASGKSNVIGALALMRRLVVSSGAASQVNDPIPLEPFRLAKASVDAPSEFQVEFLLDQTRYRYGFIADAKAVKAEWLMSVGKGNDEELFVREGQDITVGDQYSEGHERKQFVLPNALFLTLCARLNGEVAGKVVGWFQRLRFLSGMNDVAMLYETAQRLREPAQQSALSTFARHADLSIRSLSSEAVDPSKFDKAFPQDTPTEMREKLQRLFIMHETEIKTRHPLFGQDGKEEGTVELDLKQHGSEGTKKFVALSGPLHMAIEGNAVLVVDEFDASLHPLLTQAIWDWFHSPGNRSQSQLVVATHDVLLMEPERVRRDQVWFCERSERGGTKLYSLAEFDPQDVSSTTKFSRQYLLGLFGAVPRLAFMKGGMTQEGDPSHV
jgi:hypothetical protein